MGCVNQPANSRVYLRNLKETQKSGSNTNNSRLKNKSNPSAIKKSGINTNSQIKPLNGLSQMLNTPIKQSNIVQDIQNTSPIYNLSNVNNKIQQTNLPTFSRINHDSQIKDKSNEIIPKLGNIPGSIVNQNNLHDHSAIPFPSKYSWVQQICQQQYEQQRFYDIKIPNISLQLS